MMTTIRVAALMFGAFAVSGCSSNDTPASTSSKSDAGTSVAPVDGSATQSTVPDASAADAAIGADSSTAASLNGCGDTELATSDHTATSDPRAITFPANGASAAQYSIPCMTIRAGESVTWTGGFDTHPLQPAGGDSGNPVVLVTGVTTTTVAFPTAGTFGFECANHPFLMRGAIRVVP